MSDPLLRTKLFAPPVRPNLVPRPRLIQQLNQGLQLGHKLTLISAPAGFGKTTLVSEWISNYGRPAAWLSLDNGDNDPIRFLAYFIAALQTVVVDIAEEVMVALQSPQPPPIETVLISLVNEITAISERMIFVVDDYHVITSSEVDSALNFMLEHLPPEMHLVMASREDPHLPLSRLRVRDQLTELRASDIRFTFSEAAEFLNHVMGLNLSEEDITALEARTEGWIAGLQLAALSLRGNGDASMLIKSFSGSHRLVLDYLIEEVLNQQPENIQTFLLNTSILDRFTGSSCDSLTGQENGQATLEVLERANLFIVSLDGERRWYRYHHLFADLLQQRLRQTDRDQIPLLHRKASEWHEENGFTNEAIRHAIRGDDFDHAADLIEKQIDAIWGQGQHATIQRWLATLPDVVVFSRSHLCIFHAWYLFVNGQLDAAERALQAAEQAIHSHADHTTETVPQEPSQDSHSDTVRLQGRADAVRAFMASYRGDLPETMGHALQALEHLPQQELTWRCLTAFVLGDAYLFSGDMTAAYQTRLETVDISKETGHSYLILIANLRLAETLRHQAKLDQVIDLCNQEIHFVNERGISQTVAAGWLLAILGEVLAEKGDLDKALDHAHKGVELGGHGRRDVSFFCWSNLYLLRVLFCRGDIAGVEAIIEKMESVIREYDVPAMVPIQLSAWQGRLWVEQDQLQTASQWVRQRELTVDGELSFFHEFESVVLARLLIAEGRLDEANGLLQRLLVTAEAGGRISRVIEVKILQALASNAGGDTSRSLSTLEQAITFAEPHGFVRIFVDEGQPMALILRQALDRRIAPDYVRRLLAAFSLDEPKKAGTEAIQANQSELVEPLSEREIEVLQLIAEGLTNPEIATRLFLSTNTVKVHTRNIYGKLDAHSRTQAVARARALGILSYT